MSSIPSNLTRVSTMLSSQIMLGSLTRSNRDLLNLQTQMASGKQVNRPSDNVVAASGISLLDQMIQRREQLIRNLQHGESVLNNVDAALGDAASILMEAKSIGLSQIGVGSDADTAASSAVVIDSMLNELIGIANRQYQHIHFFGGAATGSPPITELGGGFQYNGLGVGMYTDLGMSRAVPITIAAADAFGAMSARVHGDTDLNPSMTPATRLQDLNGARSTGVAAGMLGSINITIDDGGGSPVTTTADLSSAHSVQDVIDALQQAIQPIDPGVTVQIDPASGDRFQIIPSGPPGAVTITIDDQPQPPASPGAPSQLPGAAADLGIARSFTAGDTLGDDVDPRLTEQTPVAALDTVPPALGMIRLTSGAPGGQVREIDLSGAQTIGDIITLVHAQDIGIRVEINQDADRLNFVNTLSGRHMSISEVAAGTTATQLGVRSMAGSTLLSDFNHGLGVQILAGNINPATGSPDPAFDVDFQITLKDGTGIDVDLAGATTVQDVLDAINQAAVDAGLGVPADFEAHLAADGNGIALTDSIAGAPGALTTVTAMNGSHAAKDLGLIPSGASAAETDGATLIGEDRATVAVESVFSHLIALRDALEAHDQHGISLATSKLDADIERLARARGEVGARTQRIVSAMQREEDLQVQDTGFKSQMQDLDFTEAALRFSLLQTQLQAGLQTAAVMTNLSLLDFLR